MNFLGEISKKLKRNNAVCKIYYKMKRKFSNNNFIPVLLKILHIKKYKVIPELLDVQLNIIFIEF